MSFLTSNFNVGRGIMLVLQVPCKPILTSFMVSLLATKPSPPPGFLVRRVYGYGHPAGLKQHLSQGGGAPCEPKAIHSWCPTVCGHPPAVGLLF